MAAQLPEKSPGKSMVFELHAHEASDSEYRTGSLMTQGRTTIHTPHYVALSSRGIVPHITQDMMRENTAIRGVYVAFEDCQYRCMSHFTLKKEGVLMGASKS